MKGACSLPFFKEGCPDFNRDGVVEFKVDTIIARPKNLGKELTFQIDISCETRMRKYHLMIQKVKVNAE